MSAWSIRLPKRRPRRSGTGTASSFSRLPKGSTKPPEAPLETRTSPPASDTRARTEKGGGKGQKKRTLMRQDMVLAAIVPPCTKSHAIITQLHRAVDPSPWRKPPNIQCPNHRYPFSVASRTAPLKSSSFPLCGGLLGGGPRRPGLFRSLYHPVFCLKQRKVVTNPLPDPPRDPLKNVRAGVTDCVKMFFRVGGSRRTNRSGRSR